MLHDHENYLAHEAPGQATEFHRQSTANANGAWAVFEQAAASPQREFGFNESRTGLEHGASPRHHVHSPQRATNQATIVEDFHYGNGEFGDVSQFDPAMGGESNRRNSLFVDRLPSYQEEQQYNLDFYLSTPNGSRDTGLHSDASVI